jgi:hypothetical protein
MAGETYLGMIGIYKVNNEDRSKYMVSNDIEQLAKQLSINDCFMRSSEVHERKYLNSTIHP